MTQREFDIILFGASGFTAKHIVRELEHSPLRIGLAARKIEKIKDTFLPKIQCDLDSIETLTERTIILINCVGPFAQTGLTVVKACISTSTHYVDITGEPGFIEKTYTTFHTEAKNRKIKIIQACGFDSVIADIGTLYLSKMFDCVEIDSTLKINNCKINYGTWASLLNSLRSHTKTTNEKKIKKLPEFRWNSLFKSYDVLFRSADPYIVKKSAQYFKSKGSCSITYKAYINIGSLFNLIAYFLIALLINIFVSYDFMHNFMLKWHSLFSFGFVQKNGPTEESILKSSFEMILVGEGVRNKKPLRKTLRIIGPDPGYKTTSICVTQCAYTLLEEESVVQSGVVTPAIAFYNTRIIDRLISEGLSFELSEDFK